MTDKLHFFPQELPGEAFYSLAARFHLHSGNTTFGQTNIDLFGVRVVRPTFDLPNYLREFSSRLPVERGLTPEVLARRFTQFNYYTAYQPRDQVKSAMARLLDGYTSLHLALGINASIVRRPERLRFCAVCRDAMLHDFGACGWRLDHQLPGVLVCPEHHVVLKESAADFVWLGAYGFVPATRRTCPLDAPDVLGAVSESTFAKLIEIARRSASILTHGRAFADWEDVTAYYRGRLRDADLMRTPHHLNVPKFEDAFGAYHGDVLRVLAPIFDRSTSNGAWVLKMARKHRQSRHPLLHILFEMFLDACPRRRSAWGEGPWACPNKIAGHGDDLTILRVSEKKSKGNIVGTFKCPCGYAYSRSVDPAGRVSQRRFKEFGPLLDPALISLVKDGATQRRASATLGLHPRSVAQAAARLNLATGWKFRPKVGPRLGKATTPPTKTRRRPHVKREPRPAPKRVDWEQLDHFLLEEARALVAVIRLQKPLVRVCRVQFERRLRGPSFLYLRAEKLPMTSAFVNEVTETVHAFQERRLKTVIEAFSANGVPTSISQVQRAATLPGSWCPRIRELLEAVEKGAALS